MRVTMLPQLVSKSYQLAKQFRTNNSKNVNSGMTIWSCAKHYSSRNVAHVPYYWVNLTERGIDNNVYVQGATK